MAAINEYTIRLPEAGVCVIWNNVRVCWSKETQEMEERLTRICYCNRSWLVPAFFFAPVLLGPLFLDHVESTNRLRGLLGLCPPECEEVFELLLEFFAWLSLSASINKHLSTTSHQVSVRTGGYNEKVWPLPLTNLGRGMKGNRPANQ